MVEERHQRSIISDTVIKFMYMFFLQSGKNWRVLLSWPGRNYLERETMGQSRWLISAARVLAMHTCCLM